MMGECEIFLHKEERLLVFGSRARTLWDENRSIRCFEYRN